MKQCEGDGGNCFQGETLQKHYGQLSGKNIYSVCITVMSSEGFASYIVTVTSVEIMYNDCLGILLFKN